MPTQPNRLNSGCHPDGRRDAVRSRVQPQSGQHGCTRRSRGTQPGRGTRFLGHLVRGLGIVCLAAASAAGAQDGAAEASQKDWQDALARIRQIALDAAQTDAHRADAVTAYVKLMVCKARHDEAVQLCREVTKSTDRPAVIEGALRAGCLAQRDRHGHLRAEIEFLASWSSGPQGQAAAAVAREVDRAVQKLASLADRAMVPAPVTLRLPHWAAPGTAGPSALHVALPKIQPPDWYTRVAFPLLKEPRK